LLLSKLLWIQTIQSNIQMEDIKLLAEVKDLDWTYGYILKKYAPLI
jgi:hypothetical protein